MKNILLLLAASFFLYAANTEPLKVVFPKDFPPHYMYDEGKPYGIAHEVFKYIAEDLGLEVEYSVQEDWCDVFNLMREGKIDIVPDLGISKEREKYFDFSDPFEIFHKFHHSLSDLEYEQSKRIKTITAILVILAIFTIFAILFFVLKQKRILLTNKELEKEVQKRTKELKRLYDRFDYAVNTVLAGYWERDLENGKIHMSQGWFGHLGYEKGELPENLATFRGLIHQDDIENVAKMTKEYLIGERDSYNTTFRLRARDGSYKWVQSLGTLTDDGKVFCGFHVDIDNLIKTREMLMLQSKSAAMGEMLSMIAHQWKQPISIIGMVSNNIKMDMALGKISDKMLSDAVSDIDEQVMYLSQTIDNFRDFFKPNKEKELINPKKIIDNTLSLIDKSLESHSIKVELSAQEVPDIDIYSNELEQVMLNILNNAKDVLTERGVKEGMIQIRLNSENGIIVIEIEDNAGGIPEEIMDKIYEPYFTTKGKLNGTGLGLYMSKIIIEEHFKGSIDVKNTLHGAKFSILIPINEPAV